MTRELYCLHYGEHEIVYKIVRRPRKTLEIAVEPDASVVIAAPEDATLDAIEAKLRKRAAWVEPKRLFYRRFQWPLRLGMNGSSWVSSVCDPPHLTQPSLSAAGDARPSWAHVSACCTR